MASPSSSPSPTDNKAPLFNPTTPAIKKPQPLPWTHQETTNLIHSYQHKWYSLKKGQLKSSQWEQVSVTVAARCGYNHPSKSATQCRHKIEKLRKRYRSERLRPYPDSWPYFRLMDCMETGSLVQCDNDSDDSDLDCNLNKSRSVNYIVKRGDGSSGDRTSGDNVGRNVRAFGVSRKPEDFYEIGDEEEEDEEEDDEGEGEEEGGGQGSRVVIELAGQIRTFAENFVQVEQKKVQMMKETAEYQMDMENKRLRMIVESQKKIVETIHEAFSTSHKKMKTVP